MTARVCPDCRGLLDVTPDGEFVEVECGGCGYRAAVHSSRVDPDVRRQRCRERAGFPAEFTGRSFERGADNAEALDSVLAWLAEYAAWRRDRADDPGHDEDAPAAPAIWGRQGRGKTLLLVRIGERLIDADCTVLFRTARGLLRELRDFDGEADAAWERAVAADVLLLDDLGAQRATDWREDQLAELIDERYQRCLPIVVTTNPPPGAWEQMLDGRTVSRLRGMTFPVELDGARDRRIRPVPEQ